MRGRGRGRGERGGEGGRESISKHMRCYLVLLGNSHRLVYRECWRERKKERERERERDPTPQAPMRARMWCSQLALSAITGLVSGRLSSVCLLYAE